VRRLLIQRRTSLTPGTTIISNVGHGGVYMNPPINRENLRDALIALVVATGLAWVVSAFEGCAPNPVPPLTTMGARLVPSQETP
jgi:hypothetical protein